MSSDRPRPAPHRDSPPRPPQGGPEEAPDGKPETGRAAGLLPAWLPPVLFVSWSALVALWYYGSSDPHAAGMKAILEFGAERLLGVGAALVAGGGLLFLAARHRGSSQRTGWGALAAMAVAAVAAGLAPGLQDRLLAVLLVLGTLAAAVGLGALLLRAVGARPRSAVEELAWSGALGLGALSLAFALLGMAGLFRTWALAAGLLAALVAGWRDLWRLLPRVASAIRRAQVRGGIAGSALLLALAALFAWRAAHCFAPPLLNELDYDALEYHLAAPLEWLSAGRLSFLPHNVYADMPAGGEMLYAPGLAMLPDFLGGYWFAKLLGLSASALAALAAAAMARRLAGRRAALAAGTILFAGTWLAYLDSAPFVEHFLLLYATVAWGAFGAWVTRGAFGLRHSAVGTAREPKGRKPFHSAQGLGREPGERPKAESRSLLIVAGLAAGFAAATKYPAAVFVAAPLGAAALLAPLARAMALGFARRASEAPAPHRAPGIPRTLLGALASAALVGALALAVASPWYIRNLSADGDPFYPLATETIPSSHWDAYKRARWDRAHSPQKSPWTALRDAFAGQPLPAARPENGGGPDITVEQAWYNLFTGQLLLVFAPLAPLALWRRRRRATAAALWWLALGAVFVAGWACLTHQVDRFLWPCFGLLAALAGAGAPALPRRAGGHLLPAVLLAGLLLAATAEFAWMEMVEMNARGPGLKAPTSSAPTGQPATDRGDDAWEMIDAANALPADARILLVGEARAALFRRPTLYATVFDTHPLEVALAASQTPRELAAKLRALGVTHVFFNWPELRRLRRTYAVARPADEDARRESGGLGLLPDGRLPGCFPLTAEKTRLLDAFERAWLVPVSYRGPTGISPLTGRVVWAFELWRLKPEL